MNSIIAGASKGIGKAIAEIFAANGHNLFLCSRGETALYKTMEELMTKYPAVIIKARPADLNKKKKRMDLQNGASLQLCLILLLTMPEALSRAVLIMKAKDCPDSVLVFTN